MGRLQRIVLVLAGCAAAYALVGYVAAFLLTRRARPVYAEPAPEGYENVRLQTRDGLAIGGWWRSPEVPRANVIFAHGNGASRAQNIDEANALFEEGCAVLPISLRAHGDSEGDRNNIGLSARHDIVAAVRFARARHPEIPTIVYGASLGAAAALFAAEELGEDVDGYVLVGPFSDLRSAVRRRTQRYLPPGLDQLAYGALRTGGRFALPEMDQIRPVRAAQNVAPGTRVLLIAGADDDRAPPSDSNAIAHEIEDATVVIADGLNHEDLSRLPARPEWRHVTEMIRTESQAGSATSPSR